MSDAGDRRVSKRRTTLYRKQEAREQREAFADEVRAALRERNLTVREVAQAIQVSPATLAGWLSGDTDPEPRALADLAVAIGRDHLRLLGLAGLLPDGLDDTVLRLDAADRLHEAVTHAERWITSVAERTVGTGAGRLIESLAKDGAGAPGWTATVSFNERGKQFPTIWSTTVTFSKTSKKAIDARSLLERLQRHAFWGEFNWPKPLTGSEGTFTVEIPNLLATRPKTAPPFQGFIGTICVVSDPNCGSQEVASLIASGLGWSFTTVELARMERYGPEADHRAQMTQTLDVLTGLSDRAGFSNTSIVWAHDSSSVLPESFLRLAEIPPPFVFYIKSSKDIAAINDLQDQELGYARERADAIETAVADRPSDASRVLRFPDIKARLSQDEHFDACVSVAFEAVQWLCAAHDGPSLSNTKGLLRELWLRQLDEDPDA